jgi:hypothetical protein
VAAVHHLKKSDLWVAGQVHVLGTVSYKLHKSSPCHSSFILREYKKILGKHNFLKNSREVFKSFAPVFINNKWYHPYIIKFDHL